MKERPILFSGEMVKAILDGRKTQTRRTVNPQPTAAHGGFIYKERFDSWDLFVKMRCKQGVVGDRLWVKETFQVVPNLHSGTMPIYRADGEIDRIVPGKWKPSIFMNRKFSRITLEITDVRVERLTEISEVDAWAEGCKRGEPTDNGGFFPAEEPDPSGIGERGWDCAKDWYADLRDSINGVGSWDKSPWVWAISFKRV